MDSNKQNYNIQKQKISLFFRTSTTNPTTVGERVIYNIINKLQTEPTAKVKEEDAIHYALCKKRHRFSVTWAGTFEIDCKPENFKNHSGFTCIGIINLSEDRKKQLKEVLKQDQYSFLVFDSVYNNGLQIVIKSSCQTIQEHEMTVDQYYSHCQSSLGIRSDELDPNSRSICYLCHLKYDPELGFKEESDVFPLSEIHLDVPYSRTSTITNPQSISDNLSLDIPVNGVTLTSKVSLLDDERKTTNYLEACHQFFVATSSFLQQPNVDFLKNDLKHNNNLCEATIKVYLTPDGKSILQIDTLFSGIQAGKQIDLLQVEYDTATGAVVLVPKSKPTSSHQEKMDSIAVNVYLVALLEGTELEQKVVQQELETKFDRRDRTIRNNIAKILSNKIIQQTSSGNSVIVARRKHGYKYYLYLKPVI